MDKNITAPSFNRSRFVRNSKERQNISKSRLDSDSGCIYTYIGDVYVLKFDEKSGNRYVACLNVVYDLVLSVYEVDSNSIVVHRFNDFKKDNEDRLDRQLASMRHTNLEARIIGMQHNQFYNTLISVFNYIKRKGIPLVEIDLFGNEKRHVAFDVKTGISFDVLVENKPYKPGELIQVTTPEQFQRSMTASGPTRAAAPKPKK